MGGPSAAIGHIGRCAGPTDPTDHAAALGSAARAAGRRRGLRSDFFPIVVWFSHSVCCARSLCTKVVIRYARRAVLVVSRRLLKYYADSLVSLRALKLATPCHATTGTAPARIPTVCRARDSAARCILQRRNRRERDRGAAGAAAGYRRCRVRPSVVRRAAQSSTMTAAPNTRQHALRASALPCRCPNLRDQGVEP